jgi:hypothetical protein
MLHYEQRSYKLDSAYRSMLAGMGDGELPDHGMISLTPKRHEIEMRVSLSAAALSRFCSAPAKAS